MLTTNTPWKSIIKFALPLMLANILQQLYNTADTIIVGNFISQNALAAVGSCMYITSLYTAISIAIGLGAGVIVAQGFGADNNKKVKNGAGTGFLMLLCLGLLISVFSFLSGEFVLKKIISVPNEIFNSALVYIKIYSLGLFFQFGYNAFASILRAVGNSKSSLYFLIITAVINVLLDLIFVIVFKLGIGSVAIATCISQLTAMVISYIYMIKKYPIFKPKWNYNKITAAEILQTGIPLTIQALIVNCGFMIMQKIANSFGAEVTASYSVACRLEIYLLIPIISILHSMSTFAGQNYGAENFARIRSGMKHAICLNLVIASLFGGLCFLFAEQIISLFALKGLAFKYAVANFKLTCVDLLLYAAYSPVNGICIGLGKSYVLSIISFVELLGRIGFALALSNIIGVACVWWSEPLAWSIVVFGVCLYYKYILKKELIK
ncbi:MATE family efflux transporter [bacterium]|nr:MATE family efflux transporter [bacterium]